jgi:hypothetical protein
MRDLWRRAFWLDRLLYWVATRWAGLNSSARPSFCECTPFGILNHFVVPVQIRHPLGDDAFKIELTLGRNIPAVLAGDAINRDQAVPPRTALQHSKDVARFERLIIAIEQLSECPSRSVWPSRIFSPGAGRAGGPRAEHSSLVICDCLTFDIFILLLLPSSATTAIADAQAHLEALPKAHK